MTLDEYQKKATKLDLFDGEDRSITSPAFFTKLLGLVGESGEVAEKFKKIYRDKDSKIDETSLKEIEKELGDVLWYLQSICQYLGLSLDDVAKNNLSKLISRQARGQGHGSGDNR